MSAKCPTIADPVEYVEQLQEKARTSAERQKMAETNKLQTLVNEALAHYADTIAVLNKLGKVFHVEVLTATPRVFILAQEVEIDILSIAPFGTHRTCLGYKRALSKSSLAKYYTLNGMVCNAKEEPAFINKLLKLLAEMPIERRKLPLD